MSGSLNRRAVPSRVLQRGYLYFLRSGDLVKIGFSKQPEKRWRHIGNMNAAELVVAGKHPGTRHDEARLHQEFSAHRLHGEWFRWNAAIAEVAHKGFVPATEQRPTRGCITPIMNSVKAALPLPYRAQQLADLTGEPLSNCQKMLSGDRKESSALLAALCRTHLVVDVILSLTEGATHPAARALRAKAEDLKLDRQAQRAAPRKQLLQTTRSIEALQMEIV